MGLWHLTAHFCKAHLRRGHRKKLAHIPWALSMDSMLMERTLFEKKPLQLLFTQRVCRPLQHQHVLFLCGKSIYRRQVRMISAYHSDACVRFSVRNIALSHVSLIIIFSKGVRAGLSMRSFT